MRMTRAAERKPTVPCELCRYCLFKRYHEDGQHWCMQFEMPVLNTDGCTFGECED